MRNMVENFCGHRCAQEGRAVVDEPRGRFDVLGYRKGLSTKVWRALRRFPRSATASYLDIATGSGHEIGARGRRGLCCNRSAIAILVIEVVRKRWGVVGGYRLVD